VRRWGWLRRAPAVRDDELAARLAALPTPRPLDDRPLHAQRLVVVDVETTGLNLARDRLLAIGAVVIEDGAIDFAQQFECTLQGAEGRLGGSMLIHGIGPRAAAAGLAPEQALAAFLAFVGDSPLLAFHAGFDRHMLAAALRRTLGLRWRHPFLDVAELAPLLCPQATVGPGGLDDWVRHFGLQVLDRHHASADALVTAELALILFSRARRQQLDSLAALEQRLATWRRRQQAPML
jgi:DNA polymerase-3 subunit epsilon